MRSLWLGLPCGGRRQALGLPADEDTLAGLFEEADEDDSGAISWDEFLDLMGKVGSCMPAPVLAVA